MFTYFDDIHVNFQDTEFSYNKRKIYQKINRILVHTVVCFHFFPSFVDDLSGRSVNDNILSFIMLVIQILQGRYYGGTYYDETDMLKYSDMTLIFT
jgi:hypothetical protein